MKTVLVTSEVTYCPNNYTPVLASVLAGAGEHITGLVIIKVSPWTVLKNIAYLWRGGCPMTRKTLWDNERESRTRKKEQLFASRGLPTLYATNINNESVVNWVKALQPDLIVNMRARCIYQQTTLATARLGCINVHHGLLPEQRGLFCDLFAVADQRVTGFTIHAMTLGIDQGTILSQETVTASKNYMEYLSTLAQAESEAISKLINSIAHSDALPLGKPNTCDHPRLTTTPTLKELKEFHQQGMVL